MEVTREEAVKLTEQIKIAHRISVAFYQRILPAFDSVAAQFGCGFFEWDTIHTSFPSRRKGSAPSQSWAWDYLPLFASSHTYRRCKNEKSVTRDDVVLIFDLYVEDSFNDNCIAKGQPDPLSLESGESLVHIGIYRPKWKISKSFDEAWREETERDPSTETWESVSPNWEGIMLKFPLVEFVLDREAVTTGLSKYITLASK